MEKGSHMSEPTFDSEIKDVLDSFLLGVPGVQTGRVFGYPAYYFAGKLFAVMGQKGVGIKVPTALAQTLLQRGDCEPFEAPTQNEANLWVQLTKPYAADFVHEQGVFRASLEFVADIRDTRLHRYFS